MRRKQTDRRFVLCVKNDDCDDLDESGEDYLYPATYFVRLQLPQEAEQAIVATG